MNRIAPFLALALSIGALECTAQGNVVIGIKGIPQNTWLLNQADSDSGNVGYVSTWNNALGISLGYQWDRGIGLQLEVLYSVQGQVKEFGSPNNRIPIETALRYVKLPLLFTFTSDPLKKNMFYGNIGPQVSILQNAEVILSGGLPLEVKDRFNAMDVSAVFALGGKFRLAESTQLGVGVRFDYGLMDAENKDLILNGAEFYPSDRPTTTNASVGFEIGFYRTLGPKLSD